MSLLEWTYLGVVSYSRALQLQYWYAEKVARGVVPRLFLLQHPPTITLGRNAQESNLRLSPEEYERRKIELYRVKRGGDVTFHGPGQIVGYTIADLHQLKCSVPEWVRGHAEAIQSFLQTFGLDAHWWEKHPGLWVGNKKIAAFGFHVARGISTHGFSVNIDPDLSFYETIVPCGLVDLSVTSLAQEGISVASYESLADRLSADLARIFGWRRKAICMISLAEEKQLEYSCQE